MLGLSPYVVAILIAMVGAQLLKYLFLVARKRSFDHVRQWYSSGGMPSTHSAVVMSALTVVGLRDGTESGLFGVTLLVAVIVLYDAIMVRRSVGEQGNAIQLIIRAIKSDALLPKAAQGHTPVELLAGMAFGVFVGLVVFSATI